MRSVARAHAFGRKDWASRSPVYPTVDREPLTPSARAAERAIRAGHVEIWNAVRALSSGTFIDLAQELWVLRRSRVRWLLAPLVLMRHVLDLRPSKCQAPPPFPPPSDISVTPIGGPNEHPRWSALGPEWFIEMLSFEGIERALPEKPNERLLICWPGAALDGITSPEGRAPRVVWLLDYQEVLPAVLKNAERIYALDADIAHSMTRQLGRLVKHLPPMIQPRLTNPIGWWGSESGVSLRNEHELPPRFSNLAALARGTVLSAEQLRTTEICLELPLCKPVIPSWAEHADRERHAKSRQMLTELSVAAWLAKIERDLGDTPRAMNPLMSLILPTYRPTYLPRILALAAAQPYRPIELVLLLHGEHFDKEKEVSALIESLDLDTQILRRPKHETLGNCSQVACEASRGKYLCRMDDDNWFGPRYANDLALALSYSDAGVVAKSRHVFELSFTRQFCETSRPEFIYTRLTAGGRRMAFGREVRDEVAWRPMQTGSDLEFMWDCFAHSIPQLAVDRFNFVRYRGHAREHTWTPPGSTLRGMPLPIEAKCEDFAV